MIAGVREYEPLYKQIHPHAQKRNCTHGQSSAVAAVAVFQKKREQLTADETANGTRQLVVVRSVSWERAATTLGGHSGAG